MFTQLDKLTWVNVGGGCYKDHQASIFEIKGKICDQVFSILIDPRSNYRNISPSLVD